MAVAQSVKRFLRSKKIGGSFCENQTISNRANLKSKGDLKWQ